MGLVVQARARAGEPSHLILMAQDNAAAPKGRLFVGCSGCWGRSAACGDQQSSQQDSAQSQDLEHLKASAQRLRRQGDQDRHGDPSNSLSSTRCQRRDWAESSGEPAAVMGVFRSVWARLSQAGLTAQRSNCLIVPGSCAVVGVCKRTFEGCGSCGGGAQGQRSIGCCDASQAIATTTVHRTAEAINGCLRGEPSAGSERACRRCQDLRALL